MIKFFLDKNADWKPKLGVGLAVLYLIWPVDLLPDLAPFIGWLDDIGFGAVAAGYLAYAVNRYISNNELRTTNDELRALDNEIRNEEYEKFDDN